MRPVGSSNIGTLGANDLRGLLRAAGARPMRIARSLNTRRVRLMTAQESYTVPGFTPSTGEFPGVDIDAVHRKFSGKSRP